MDCIEDNVQAWLWNDDYGKIVVRYNRYNKDGTSQNEVRMWTADGTATLEEGLEDMELYGYAHCTGEGIGRICGLRTNEVCSRVDVQLGFHFLVCGLGIVVEIHDA